MRLSNEITKDTDQKRVYSAGACDETVTVTAERHDA